MNWMIAVVTVFFALMGVAALYRPAEFLAYMGCEVVRDEGRNEVRAVYGGFGLVIAGSLVWAAGRPEIREGYLICLTAACLGMAAGRIYSLVVDRGISPLMSAALAGELTLAGLLFASLA